MYLTWGPDLLYEKSHFRGMVSGFPRGTLSTSVLTGRTLTQMDVTRNKFPPYKNLPCHATFSSTFDHLFSLLLPSITRLPKVIWQQAASPPQVADPLVAAVHNRSPYLPGGANVHARLTHDSYGQPHSPPLQPFFQTTRSFPTDGQTERQRNSTY